MTKIIVILVSIVLEKKEMYVKYELLCVLMMKIRYREKEIKNKTAENGRNIIKF